VQEYTLTTGSRFRVTADEQGHSMFGSFRLLDVDLLPGTAASRAVMASRSFPAGDLPGGERFAWRPGDVVFEEPWAAGLVRVSFGVIPDTTAAFDEAKHPRGPHGEWVSVNESPALENLLESAFHPVQMDAARVKHPRSGYMVESGISRRVSRPPEPDKPVPPDSLGPEGPATFDVIDHGDPNSPSYNSLAYMQGKRLGAEPIPHVYRGMSAAEWEQAQQRGYIESDKRGDISRDEGTNAAADPRSAASYLPQSGESYIAKIKVRPEDKWFTIRPDEYLRTRQRIPLDRVEKVLPMRRVGKYAEYQTRAAKGWDEAKRIAGGGAGA